MKTIKLDLFQKMLYAGAKILEIECEYINDLNVFPIPDGDTGSNMKTTTAGAIIAIKEIEISNFSQLAKIFSRGLLMNARGNSGVILSQIFRGFMDALNNDADEVSIEQLKQAFNGAKEKAYASVSTPIEGTILTVIRVINERISERQNFDSVEDLFAFVTKEAQIILERTPEMLPSLKEANVVDSGGYGLVSFLKGMYQSLTNTFDEKLIIKNEEENIKSKTKPLDLEIIHKEKEEGFGYCSEIILSLRKKIIPNSPSKSFFEFEKYKSELAKIGDSIVAIQDEDLVKVHLHTLTPYKFLQLSQKYGEFDKIKIENMTNQFYESLERKGLTTKKENKLTLSMEQKIIATVPSEKFKKMFIEEHGIDNVIVTETEGAPSIQRFVDEINSTNSSQIFIVTDDSNIVLAAEQASKIVAENNILVSVIGAYNVFETLLAISHFEQQNDYRTNFKTMNKIVKKARSGMITTSIKNVKYPHITVNKDDYIGIINKKIIASEKNAYDVLLTTIEMLIESLKKPEICYIYYGINASQTDVHQIEKYISEKYGIICDLRYTGQSLYHYYIGIQ